MPTLIIFLIVLFIIIGAITLVVIGLRDCRESDPLQQRLAEFAARGETATLEEIELSQPITDRVIIPVARRVGELVSRFTPQNALQATAHKLELAGSPRGIDRRHLLGITSYYRCSGSRLLAIYFCDW